MNNPRSLLLSMGKGDSARREAELKKKLTTYFAKGLVDSVSIRPKLALDTIISFQGFLHKRGGLFEKWKERWICLCGDSTLRIIYNEGDDRVKINLATAVKSTFEWNQSKGLIRIECIDRKWKFLCGSKAEFDAWRKGIGQIDRQSFRQSILCSGWLEKRGKTNTGWKKRYCQLNINGIFCYYKTEKCKKRRGHFDLHHAATCNVDFSKYHQFIVHTTQPVRDWYFKSKTRADAKRWIVAINPFLVPKPSFRPTDSQDSDADPQETRTNSRPSLILQHSLSHRSAKGTPRRGHRRINSANPLTALHLKPSAKRHLLSPRHTGKRAKTRTFEPKQLKLSPSPSPAASPRNRRVPSKSNAAEQALKKLNQGLEKVNQEKAPFGRKKTPEDVWPTPVASRSPPLAGLPNLVVSPKASEKYPARPTGSRPSAIYTDAKGGKRVLVTDPSDASVVLVSAYSNPKSPSVVELKDSRPTFMLPETTSAASEVSCLDRIETLSRNVSNHSGVSGTSTETSVSLRSDMIDPRLLGYTVERMAQIRGGPEPSSDEEKKSGTEDEDSTEEDGAEPPGLEKWDTTRTNLSTTEQEEDDWTWADVLRNAFYRFAGVSPYSNTNLKMSKNDLAILMECLELSEHTDTIFSQMGTDSSGNFDIGDFNDVFQDTDTEKLITSSASYKFLTVTLMTMKNIDPTYNNRIGFTDFWGMVQSFFDEEEEAEEIFHAYDEGGIGLLTVANLFAFLRDYCDLEEDDFGDEESP